MICGCPPAEGFYATYQSIRRRISNRRHGGPQRHRHVGKIKAVSGRLPKTPRARSGSCGLEIPILRKFRLLISAPRSNRSAANNQQRLATKGRRPGVGRISGMCRITSLPRLHLVQPSVRRFHGGGKRRSVIAVCPTGEQIRNSPLPRFYLIEYNFRPHVEAVHDGAG